MVRQALLAGVTALLPLASAAQSPMDRFFPTPATCYARDYTAAHLAAHPQQRTTSLALTPLGRSDRLLDLRLVITFRGQPGEAMVAVAYCENISNSLYCLMEGDAGAFAITAAKDGAILLEVSSRGMSFEGARDFVTLESDRGDDRSFLLRPTWECR